MHGATELSRYIRVQSTEGSMPWHGDLRAGTGDFLTGEQKWIGKGVSRLCGLNAEHSSLCGK